MMASEEHILLNLQCISTHFMCWSCGLQIINFTLEYKDTNELTKLATEIPKMQDVTIHSLNT